MARSAQKLTARKVQTAGPGRYVDGNGLMLFVRDSGTRSWVFRYQLNGVRRDLGLGPYPEVSLQKARAKVQAMRELLVDGKDPRSVVQREPLTFRRAAEQLIEAKAAGWKNKKHAAQVAATLEAYVFPKLGNRDVASIGFDDVLAVLKPIWHQKPETASRVRQRIEAVLAMATTKNARSGPNPAAWRGNLDTILPAPAKVRAVQHHAAMPWKEIPALWQVLDPKASVSASALKFLLLTAARSGEVRAATWSEIDLEDAVWTIPAARMKAGREHRVPLSAAALAIIGTPGKPNEYLFPSPKEKPLTDVALSKVLKAVAPGYTVHGLRSSFRDWAGETTNHPREVIERALAHQITDRAEAAYARGDLFTKRRRLMDDWAAYVSSPVGEVVPLHERRADAMS